MSVKLLLCLFFASTFSIFGQVNFSFVRHDFGELVAHDDRFVDVVVTNNGSEKVYILRIERLYEVSNLIEKDLILPGEAVRIRFQVNPKKQGKFSYTIPIYTSNQQQPTNIQLTGILKELSDEAMMQDCPDFSKSPSSTSATDFTLTILTIDAQTKKPVGEVAVVILQNGRPLGKVKTDGKGQVKTKIPLGITYFYAQREGFSSAELAQYVNFKRNKVILELDRDLEGEELLAEEVVTEKIAENHYENEVYEIKDTIVSITPIEKINTLLFNRSSSEEISKMTQDTISNVLTTRNFEALDKNDFNENDFRPINLVFVIDVSSSMRQEDRLELMKFALYQLVDMLRPMDQMGLVAYSTQARVLLPVTKGDDKEGINAIVESMKASGLTAGAEGIMLGFKQVRKNFKPDAHNQVIVITDGAFNSGVMDYEKQFKRYLKRGITLSVVGIKNNEKAENNMREVAALGQGEFVVIHGLSDAQENLKQMIRLGAFRN